MARDRRHLAPEEEALWTAVKRTIHPIHPGERAPLPEAAPPVPEAAAPPAAAIAASAPKPVPPPRPDMPGLHTLGRRDRKRLVRGTAEVDGRIDLHGLTQDAAYARLSGFLARSQSLGHQVVLVITGKGRGGSGFEGLHHPERGVLRRVVPIWLSLPEFRPLVLGFEDAHLAHGGAGALYVRIRRRKS